MEGQRAVRSCRTIAAGTCELVAVFYLDGCGRVAVPGDVDGVLMGIDSHLVLNFVCLTI
jgi:hypothetical protein